VSSVRNKKVEKIDAAQEFDATKAQ